jgi:hypothetical protein
MLTTRRYLEVTRAEEVSTPTGDMEKMKILEDEAVEAAQWRELARKAVREHAATHAEEQPETRK